MKKFERDLKIIHKYDAEGHAGVFQGIDGLSESDLKFLSAKGFVKLSPAGDNELFAELTAKGRTYFLDQEEQKKSARKNWFAVNLIDILALLVSAIALIRTF